MRLMNKSAVVDDQVCFDEKVKSLVYDLFRVRYDMHRDVYSHPVGKQAEYVIVFCLCSCSFLIPHCSGLLY